MDKLANFADKMFLIKMNQLTGLDKQSTNILEKKASVYYLETTKLKVETTSAKTLITQPDLRVDTTNINTHGQCNETNETPASELPLSYLQTFIPTQGYADMDSSCRSAAQTIPLEHWSKSKANNNGKRKIQI